MSKIKIVVDSTSGFDMMEKRYDAEVLRLFVFFDGKEYVDGVDITPEDFYRMLDENKDVLPSTSQPTLGGTVEIFERLSKEGYEDIIAITISSRLSGTYATTVSARDMLDSDINVHVVDTLNVTYPVYFLGQIAYDMASEGKSAQEIVNHIEGIKGEYELYFAVGDLTLLRKNGRLSTASALIGTVLKVKPVLKIDDDGTIQAVTKVRTMKKSLQELVNTFFEITDGKAEDIVILNSNCVELAEEFRGMLVSRDASLGNTPIYPITPVIGSHLGTGTVAISFRKKN
ncbi:DegV family protein [Mycoplasmatota bacterium WC44]